MNNKLKKPGFTLIELIAVLAIIAVLFAVLTPKVSVYINEAKKTKALDDVRQVLMIADTYSIKENESIKDSSTFASIKEAVKKYVDKDEKKYLDKIKTIDDSMTYLQMKEILNGEKVIKLSDEGVIIMK